jgi:hypothetical protein
MLVFYHPLSAVASIAFYWRVLDLVIMPTHLQDQL